MTDRRHDQRARSRPPRDRFRERTFRHRMVRSAEPGQVDRGLDDLNELITVYGVAGAMPSVWIAGGGYHAILRQATMGTVRQAKFQIGEIVRHRFFPFRGVIFDVDPVFANTEEWWESIPEEIRPLKDQPFYHLLAENEDTTYVAYVSEQNLLPDESGQPSKHPDVMQLFERIENGRYVPRRKPSN